MFTGQPRAARGTWRSHLLDLVITTFAVISLIAAGSRLTGQSAQATHLTGDSRHLGTMHTPFVDEDFCTETSNTTRSWSTIQTNITNAVWIEQTDVNQEWDAKGFDAGSGRYRVWFFAHWNNPCQLLPAAERDPITIEYRMFDNNTGNCGAVICNVAIGTSPYTDDLGHQGMRFYLVYLYAPYTAGEVIAGYYRHQVNHETGHTMGLDDGGAPCPDSVMHTSFYGCGQDRPYPSAGDTASETNRIFN